MLARTHQHLENRYKIERKIKMSKIKTTSRKKDFDLSDKVEKAGVLKQAIKKVDQGFKIPDATRPRSVPEFPDDITALSSELVGSYHAIYRSELAWIKSCLAVVEIDYSYAKHVLCTFRKNLFLSLRQEGETVTDANAWVDVNNGVQNSEKELAVMEAQKRLLEARYEVFTDYAAIMSREITRRRDEAENRENKPSKIEKGKPDKKVKGKILDPLRNRRK